MRTMLTAALGCGMLLAVHAQPQVRAPKQMPIAVQRYIAGLADECKGYGGKPGKSPALIDLADLNGDGMLDYIIDKGAFNCDGAGASAMSNGQSGSDLTVFVGTADGNATQAYTASVYGAELDKTTHPPTLWVAVSGKLCGQKNADKLPVASLKGCKRPLAWNAAQRRFDYGPPSQIKPLQ